MKRKLLVLGIGSLLPCLIVSCGRGKVSENPSLSSEVGSEVPSESVAPIDEEALALTSDYYLKINNFKLFNDVGTTYAELSDGEIFFSLKDGKLQAKGSARVLFEKEYEQHQPYSDIAFVIDDGMFYASNSGKPSSYRTKPYQSYTVGPIEGLLSDVFTESSVETVFSALDYSEDVLNWAETDLIPLFEKSANAVSSLANGRFTFQKDLFVENNNTYSFNKALLTDLVNDLYNDNVNVLINKYFGTGTFEAIEKLASTGLDLSIGKIIETLKASAAFDIDEFLTKLDNLAKVITKDDSMTLTGLISSISGHEMIDLHELIASESFTSQKISDFVKEILAGQFEEAPTEEQLNQGLESVQGTIDSVIEMLKTKTVLQIVGEINSSLGNPDSLKSTLLEIVNEVTNRFDLSYNLTAIEHKFKGLDVSVDANIPNKGGFEIDLSLLDSSLYTSEIDYDSLLAKAKEYYERFKVPSYSYFAAVDTDYYTVNEGDNGLVSTITRKYSYERDFDYTFDDGILHHVVEDNEVYTYDFSDVKYIEIEEECKGVTISYYVDYLDVENYVDENGASQETYRSHNIECFDIDYDLSKDKAVEYSGHNSDIVSTTRTDDMKCGDEYVDHCKCENCGLEYDEYEEISHSFSSETNNVSFTYGDTEFNLTYHYCPKCNEISSYYYQSIYVQSSNNEDYDWNSYGNSSKYTYTCTYDGYDVEVSAMCNATEFAVKVFENDELVYSIKFAYDPISSLYTKQD